MSYLSLPNPIGENAEQHLKLHLVALAGVQRLHEAILQMGVAGIITSYGIDQNCISLQLAPDVTPAEQEQLHGMLIMGTSPGGVQ